MRKKLRLMTALAVLSSGQMAGATVFDDGLLNVLTTPITTPSTVSNDTTLEIQTDGSIEPPEGNGIRPPALTAQDTSAEVVNGGTLRGGNNTATGAQTPGTGFEFDDGGALTLFDGLIRGGNKSNGNTISGVGGVGIGGSDGTFVMTGGDVRGGNARGNAGTGGKAISGLNLSVDIRGGSITGGNKSGGLGRGGIGLDLGGTSTGVITGGTISGGSGSLGGGSAVFLKDEADLTLRGGMILDTIRLVDDSILRVIGDDLLYRSGSGLLTGTLVSGEEISLTVEAFDSAQVILVPATSPMPVPLPAALPVFAIGLVALWRIGGRGQARRYSAA